MNYGLSELLEQIFKSKISFKDAQVVHCINQNVLTKIYHKFSTFLLIFTRKGCILNINDETILKSL